MSEKPEHIVQLCGHQDRVYALTSAGRIFMRVLDSRNFDGRNPEKYLWKEIELPV